MDSYDNVYNNVCRTCLTATTGKMVPLLDKTKSNGLSCFGKAVSNFANITIKPTDDLPSQICQLCLYLLRNAVKFKRKCEQNNKLTKQIVSNAKMNKVDFKEVLIDCLLFLHHFPEENKREHSNYVISLIDTNKVKITNKITTAVVSCDKINLNDQNKSYVSSVNNDHFDDIQSNYELNDSFVDKEDDVYRDFNHKNDSIDEADTILNLMEQLSGESSIGINAKNTLNKINIDLNKDRIRLKRGRKRKSNTDKALRRVKLKGKTGKNCIKTDTYTCKDCGKKLSNKHTLVQHEQRHKGFTFVCEVCGKGYASKSELDFHQANHHGVGRLMECEQCGYKTSRKYDLVEHVRLHTGERPYTCDKCGLTFRRKYIYKKHIVHHSEKKIQCPHCPRRFFHRSHMLGHCNNIHSRRFVYECLRCGCLYARSCSLRRHLQLKHDIERDQQVLHKVYADPSAPLTTGGQSNRRVKTSCET